MVAYKNGSTWKNQFVDNSDEAGRFTSIAIDSNEVVHISYNLEVTSSGATSYYLKHPQGKPGAWSSGVVDNSGSAGTYTSIAVDDAGISHISYHAWFLDDSDPFQPEYTAYLKHASGVFGSWSHESIESGSDNDIGKFSSIIAAGTAPLLELHISYMGSDSQLRYADYGLHVPKPSPDWEKETVDQILVIGKYTSIALDSHDKAHISYVDDTNLKLKYATNASGVWAQPSIIDGTGALIGATSIKIDSNGRVNITYFSDIERLKFAAANPSQ